MFKVQILMLNDTWKDMQTGFTTREEAIAAMNNMFSEEDYGDTVRVI